MHAHATTYKKKKKEVTVNNGNIKQATAIQVTFILENNFQKQIFHQNLIISSPTFAYILNTA